jgi:hypothetical protein
MAYRARKGDWKGWAALLVLAGTYSALKPFFDAASGHWGAIGTAVAAGVIGLWMLKSFLARARDRARRAALLAKYGSEEIVEAIMGQRYWQGQTEAMLVDSLGAPAGTDRKVLKTKVSETWKYHPTGRGRYALRLILDNGVVVGWDHKGG